MDDEDKLTRFNKLRNTSFFSMTQTKGLKSARMQDALYNLPKAIAKIRTPPLPAIEKESDNLQGDGVKIIIPSNIIDINMKLEILLGIKLSGHTDTLTKASKLIDELYKRGEIQNKQQYRNAPNKIFNIIIFAILLVYILRYTYTYTSCNTFIEIMWYEYLYVFFTLFKWNFLVNY